MRSLADREEIRAVVYRMCRGTDRRDAALRRSVFHDDAVENHGSFNGSAAEFVEWSMRELAGAFLATQHLVGNILIDLDGDRAQVESSLLSCHLMEDDIGQYVDILGGRYFDQFERRQGRWKIARRQVLIDWRLQQRGDASCPDFPHIDKFVRGARNVSDLTYSHGFLAEGER